MAGDHYRALADKCDARACVENDLAIRREWEIMAQAYRRLAEQAERNARTDIVYEPPAERLPDREPPPQPPQAQQPQAQQQPQGKLEKEE